MTDLKPCPNPWCKYSDPQLRKIMSGLWYVECDDCGLQTGHADNDQNNAIERWNTRPAPKVIE